MRTATKIILVLGILILCCNGLWGCKGGKEAKVGNIEGPDWIWETTSGYYKVHYDGTQVTYEWSCNPTNAGYFSDPTAEISKFTGYIVDADKIIELRVVVNADQWGPVLRTKNITAKNITGWHVSEIDGPILVAENTSADFSILAGGDTGVTYDWSVDPPGVGYFDNPTVYDPQFTAGWVSADTPAEIRVTVNSDHYPPEIKTLEITIVNAADFTVGEITGPDLVNENTSVGYSIAASGDSGITYSWSANPPDIGDLLTPTAATTQYSAGDVLLSTPVELQVVVDSDNNSPVTKTKWITIGTESPFLWANRWGDWGMDYALDMAVDPAGDIYVTGEFVGSVDFDPGPGTQTYHSEGSSDIFLGKYGNTGNLQWVRTWGGHYADGGRSVAVDTSFSVYTTGYYRYTADFHPGLGQDIHTSLGNDDVFLSKFDSNGNFIWAETWGGDEDDRGMATATNSYGSVFVAGYFEETVDFDPVGFYVDERTSNGYKDAFVSLFTSTGNFLSVETWGDTGNDEAHGVAVAPSGQAYTAGYFEGDVDFDSSAGVEIYSSAGGSEDAFIRFPQGSSPLAYIWGGIGLDSATDIFFDSSGNFFAGGNFTGLVDLDPTSGTDTHSGGQYPYACLIGFDGGGGFKWAETWGGHTDNGNEVRSGGADPNGNIFATGHFSGIMTIDTGTGPQAYQASSTDAYLIGFNSDGNPRWVGTWGGSSYDKGTGIAVYGSENIYITGYFGSSVDFDPGPGVWDLYSGGMYDAYLSKFDLSEFF